MERLFFITLPLWLSSPVIEVQFERNEFSVEESIGEMEISLTISNPIVVDTYFFVLALTYQEYDDQYEDLKEIYPNLDPFTLKNEYDQAECKLIIRSLTDLVIHNS